VISSIPSEQRQKDEIGPRLMIVPHALQGWTPFTNLSRKLAS